MRSVYQADELFLYSFVSGNEEKMLGRTIKPVAIFAISVILIIITVRTVIFSFSPTPPEPCLTTDEDFISLSEKRLANFQTALRFKTVSKSKGNYNRDELTKFGKFIVSCESVFRLFHFFYRL